MTKEEIIKCGNANPNGNIELTYKGGCKKELKIEDAYRCVGCGGWFLNCGLKKYETYYYLTRTERKYIKDL